MGGDAAIGGAVSRDVSGGDVDVVQGSDGNNQILDLSGGVTQLTGSYIPPNQEKRRAYDSDDDSQITTDDLEWQIQGRRLNDKR